MLRNIKVFVGSKRFLYIIIGLFLIQALWFAGSIKAFVPPDESYHFGVSEYYSRQPIKNGPIINHQSDESLQLGELQRTPNYLYHYALGNILKIKHKVIPGLRGDLLLLRLVNIGIALAGLLVLIKLLVELEPRRVYRNVTVFLLLLTGMFTWLSAAVSYDNAVFLLVSLMLLMLAKVYKDKSALALVGLICATLVTLLTKEAAALFIVPIYISLIFMLGNNKTRLKQILKNFKATWVEKKLQALLLAAFTLLLLGLFTERYGQNLVKYHAISPACQKVHTEAQCNNYWAYVRDKRIKQNFQEFKAGGGQVIYDPLGYAGNWAYQMYDGLFFYFGTYNMSPTHNVANLFALYALIVVVGILLYYKRGSVIITPLDKAILLITIFYTAGLFWFNLNSYFHTATMYGFQGRYLLPILPFAYLIFARAWGSGFLSFNNRRNITFTYLFIALSALVIFNHIPLLTFYRGADEIWYTHQTLSVNTKIQKVLTKSHIAEKGSIPSVSKAIKN